MFTIVLFAALSKMALFCGAVKILPRVDLMPGNKENSNQIPLPWTTSLNFVPAQHVRFILYAANEPDVGQPLHDGFVQKIRESSFNASHSTRIIIHGWMGDQHNDLNVQLRSAYHNLTKPLNVIVVDWSSASKNPNYLDAMRMVPEVGRSVAELISCLQTITGHPYDQVVLVGHSLGAHIAGFAGKEVFKSNGVRLQAIVGLDPAGPGYQWNQPENRLDGSDAMYVQTIHTNMGQEGIVGPIGAASFFPNWGGRQPGCGVELAGACSHSRSVAYFVDSVSGFLHGRRFVGVRCAGGYVDIERKQCNTSGWALMGGDPLVVEAVTGVFFVETAAQSPYALN